MPSSSYQEVIPSSYNFFSSGDGPYITEICPTDEAIIKLYRNHGAELLLTILKVVHQHETAEDILQDTFIKIKAHIHLYEQERSQLLTWSKTIAKNMALDHLRLKTSRNNKLNQSLDYSQNELAIKHIYSFNTDRIGLKQLIHVLTSEQLAILTLFYYEGYTHEEISKALNIPLGTIKTRIRTAIMKLRKYFN